MARPKKLIDEEQVRKLAAINCSLEEMASVLNCEKTTLHRRFASVIKKGRDGGKMSLKRKQYEVAMSGNVTMLIWLGKIFLEQRERVEESVTINQSPQLAEAIEQISKAIAKRDAWSSPQNKALSLEPAPGLLSPSVESR